MNSYSFRNNFKLLLKRTDNCKQKNATLELLKSSVLVSVSGALRVYLASLLLQTDSDLLTCIAGGLVIYSVYTLDRSLDSEEDAINRKELSGSRKEIGLAASVITFLIGSYVLARRGLVVFAFLPLGIGFLYSKGIKIGKYALKLKGGLGIKNVVVGLAWGIFIAGLAGCPCSFNPCSLLPCSLSVSLVFILYGVKTGVNSAIDDFKDITGDTLAGIKTLPICLGELKTRNVLLGMHLLSHMIVGIAMLKGLVAFESIIIICSFLCGLICIQNYTNEERHMAKKSELTFFKDGESTITIILKGIVSIVLVQLPY